MNPYQIINPQSIQENMMNNTEIIKQMIPMYLGQGVEDFKSLENAILSQNHEEIRLKAHHIKPTMQYLGAQELRLKFQNLEDSSASNLSITEITQLFEEIKIDFEKAMIELKNYQSSLG